MCYKIESTFALIHQLKNNSSCTIKELVIKKNLIEKKIPSVYVDVSKRSILNSVTSFPEIFYWKNNQIKRRKKSNDYFNSPLIDFFDNDIGESIKSKITEIFEID